MLKKAYTYYLVAALASASSLTPSFAIAASQQTTAQQTHTPVSQGIAQPRPIAQVAPASPLTSAQAQRVKALTKLKWAVGGAVGTVAVGYVAFVVWIMSSGPWGPGR